jgi:hypothetical protein
MAECLVTLPAKQAARVRFPVRARPTFSVEKVALFCNPASGGTFSSTAIEIIKWAKKKFSSASEGDPHLEAWEGLRRHRKELFFSSLAVFHEVIWVQIRRV